MGRYGKIIPGRWNIEPGVLIRAEVNDPLMEKSRGRQDWCQAVKGLECHTDETKCIEITILCSV